MISYPRRRTAVIVSATVAVAAGAALATTGLAGAATVPGDLKVTTSRLQFQPPATIPDAGAATVTVTNVGTTRPATATIEVDAVSRLNRVTADGTACRLVALPSGKHVGRCAVPSREIPAARRSLAVQLGVEIASPPGDCSCVPFTVRLIVPGDTDTANNVATAAIVR